jgi:dual oxidase
MIITTFSFPAARKRSFEAFQIVHLLIFPMLVLLALHGTDALLQYPALGFVLAGPLTVILCEKFVRASQLLQSRVARIKPIGNDCVEVTIFAPGGKQRRFYRPGQYILVRVPKLSRFQWHPFTVVRAGDSELVVIAKNNGGWTRCLQGQPEFTNVNLDGPFGAPCQGFWNYDNNILIGMGTGLTPSAAIIHELLTSPIHPWTTDKQVPKGRERAGHANYIRKQVSVLWVVRDATSLDTFTPLLTAMASLPQHDYLDLSWHIYMSRSMTPLHTERGLTPPGVIFSGKGSSVEIHLGKRPIFVDILQDHHQEYSTELRQTVLRTGQPRTTRPRVGVFFCGPPSTKSELRQLCFERTLQGVVDGSDLEYHFHPEVF